MKKTTFILALLSSSLAFSQVGFNTPDPQATIDILAKNTTGKSTNVDGLLIPRVDRERAQSMKDIPTSTLLYINNVTTGSQTGIAQNIDTIGYYYYNGTAWVKLSSTDKNIYTSNGTLTENRTVTQAGKTLAFTATSNNAFSVDGSTFSVDAAKNSVGIGTITPGSKLSIIGNFALGTNYAGLSAPSNGAIIEGALGIGTSNTAPAKLRIVSQNDDVANEYHFDDYSGSTDKYNAIRFHKSRGMVAAHLDLNKGDNMGSLEFIPHFNGTIESYHNGTGINALYEGNGTNNLTSLRFFTSGDMPYTGERMRIDPTGKVGIGTTAPTNLLHISSSTAGAMKIVDGTQGADKVLTSDSDGVATWKPLPSGGITENIYTSDGTLAENRTVTQADKTLAFTANSVNAFSVDGKTFSVDAKNHWIGFGTNTPSSKFEIISDNEGPNSGNNFYFKGFGSSKEPSLILSSANGTAANPKNLVAGDYVGSLYFAPRANNTFNTAIGSSISSYYRGDGTSILTDLVLRTSNKSRIYINENGKIGIGTDIPTNLFHISSSTAGAMKIVDGTQGAEKVLTSDADGVATWKQVATTFSTLSLPQIKYVFPANTHTAKYTGVPITLPPGKWLLNLTMGMDIESASDEYKKGSLFIRFRLGDSTADMSIFNFSADALSPKLASGSFSLSQDRGIVNGNLVMNNTSGKNKTYYLFVDRNNSPAESTFTVQFDWNEAAITYQKIQ